MINIKNIVITLLLSLLLIGCTNDNNINNDSDITIQKEFENKLVYEIDDSIPIKNYKNNCSEKWWTFNECWTTCWPDAEVCVQVCAYTCEFENWENTNTWTNNSEEETSTENNKIEKDFSDNEAGINWKIVIDKENKQVVINWEATWVWYFEWQFNVELVNGNWTMLSQEQIMANWEWMTEDYVPFNETTINYEELNTNNIQVVFNKANPSWLPENDFSKTININLK